MNIPVNRKWVALADKSNVRIERSSGKQEGFERYGKLLPADPDEKIRSASFGSKLLILRLSC